MYREKCLHGLGRVFRNPKKQNPRWEFPDIKQKRRVGFLPTVYENFGFPTWDGTPK